MIGSALRANFYVAVLAITRVPAYAAGLFLFPIIFFLLFGVSFAQTRAEANIVMASYAAFAVLGVALLQFGVGIGLERTLFWEAFVRTLPVPAAVRLAARTGVATIAAAASAGSVVVTAVVSTPVHLTAAEWSRLVIALFAGAIPFALIGITIGYWVNPRAALPVANLIYLPLAFIGLGTQPLPSYLDAIRRHLPTREWAHLVWDPALGRPWAVSHWLVLLAYAAAFSGLAALGYWRDQGDQ